MRPHLSTADAESILIERYSDVRDRAGKTPAMLAVAALVLLAADLRAAELGNRPVRPVTRLQLDAAMALAGTAVDGAEYAELVVAAHLRAAGATWQRRSPTCAATPSRERHGVVEESLPAAPPFPRTAPVPPTTSRPRPPANRSRRSWRAPRPTCSARCCWRPATTRPPAPTCARGPRGPPSPEPVTGSPTPPGTRSRTLTSSWPTPPPCPSAPAPTSRPWSWPPWTCTTRRPHPPARTRPPHPTRGRRAGTARAQAQVRGRPRQRPHHRRRLTDHRGGTPHAGTDQPGLYAGAPPRL